ncbi:MAG: hydroxypyruvate isomerase family protein [Cyclobacteriaceae bacterium]
MKKENRRSAIKKMAGTAAAFPLAGIKFQAQNTAPQLKGNIRHSVCKWCYNNIPLDEFCAQVKKMGITSVELLGPAEWPTLQKHGLDCALAAYWTNGFGIAKCYNRKEHHDKLYDLYAESIPMAAKAGLKQIITFSGNREGMDDETGMKNCAEGLKRIMPIAEKHGITIVMELLNSKVNHPDYMCDHTEWGVELAKMIGSENFKLLYDIYHMQIMEGDVIATIQKYHPYISHYHTGGVPGRAEIDESQELYYPAIMKAIVDTGYKGYVAQEFVPKKDPLASLEQGVRICDV